MRRTDMGPTRASSAPGFTSSTGKSRTAKYMWSMAFAMTNHWCFHRGQKSNKRDDAEPQTGADQEHSIRVAGRPQVSYTCGLHFRAPNVERCAFYERLVAGEPGRILAKADADRCDDVLTRGKRPISTNDRNLRSSSDAD